MSASFFWIMVWMLETCVLAERLESYTDTFHPMLDAAAFAPAAMIC
jgi:hypothetical protein